MKKILLFVILLTATMLITNAIQIRNTYTQERAEKHNISFGPEILLNRKEIKDPGVDNITVSKAFLDTCIAWYRKFECDNPIHIEEYLLFSDPFADSIIMATYTMEPEFHPSDSLLIKKTSKGHDGISSDRCIKEMEINSNLKMSFSISAECSDYCWSVDNTGDCYLYSRIYFHKNGEIKYGMLVNEINMLEMRSDVISVLKNDTLISLYGIQQTFADGDKMNLWIVRKSIPDLLATFKQATHR